ncbi:50S ribosomal protein L11 methyltransferase [Amorphus orientalis]|uniref:Ribosomal protein L11 methyltransferase n=1 Tax=Amorphus orientalis TaxID=649198 RepID=A0AAE4ARK9_9HYPH|nr:50S ribosomal protein L11 methyltransferase [Amorphus orientalis]MDQ0315266.1 ribosomal protein L11 methyltransferase [Amorphus orientalis]
MGAAMTRDGTEPARVLKLACTVAADQAAAAEARLETALGDRAAALSRFEVVDEGPWTVEALLYDVDDADEVLREIRAGLDDPDLAKKLNAEWLGDEDWVAMSLAGLVPVRAGRFTIFGSHDRAKVPPSRWRLEIDAGQAFGTGHHETTVGCLLAIEALAKQGLLPAEAIDLGTGTGVLAAAMVRLGVARVVASDIDPIAVDVAQANLRAFGVGGRVETVAAAGFAHKLLRDAQPGLIVANILARPLAALAPDVRRSIAPDGRIVLSGLRLADEWRIRSVYGAHRFAMVRAYRIGAWATLVMRAR